MKQILCTHSVAGDVIENRIAEYAVHRIVDVDIADCATNDNRELRLRVNTTVVRANLNSRLMADQARRGFQEKRRMIRSRYLAFVARGIVHRDADNFSWHRHGREPTYIIDSDRLSSRVLRVV